MRSKGRGMHARQMGPRQCRASTFEGSHEARDRERAREDKRGQERGQKRTRERAREDKRGQESMIARECPTTR